MKIASWNVNGIRARTEHVVNWLEATQPDVLAIQESKVVDDLFPYDEYSKLGYHPLVYGQKAYNGVAIVSPHPIETLFAGFPDSSEEEDTARQLCVRIAGFTVVNSYVPQGKSPNGASPL